MNCRCQIDCSEKITIGKDCAIGKDVMFRDSDSHEMVREGFQMTKPISLGNHVWIGTRSIILKGIIVNDNSVIAAGSLCNRDVLGYSLVGGVPAKIISYQLSF